MATIDEKKIEKLQKLLSMVDESLTKEEFVASFKNLIDFVKRVQTKSDADFSGLRKEMIALQKQLLDENAEDSNELREQLKDITARLVSNVTDMMDKMNKSHKEWEKRINSIKNGQDADEEKITKRVVTEVSTIIPKIEDIEKNLPKLGKPIRDSLELLQGDERLDKSAIKGLDEELKKITVSKGAAGGNTGGGAVARTRVHYYDLTSQCNGILKVFAVPLNFGIIGVFSTQFPINYRPLVDWTEGNRTLTLTSQVSAPETGQTLWIAYLK